MMTEIGTDEFHQRMEVLHMLRAASLRPLAYNVLAGKLIITSPRVK